MLCPKDNVVCDPLLLQDVEVDMCPKCEGVWLEQAEVRRIVRHLQLPQLSTVDDLLASWERAEHQGTPPVDFWKESKLTCPRDVSQMQKHYFAGSHIGVDHCLICKGFWLDGGELLAVAKYVAPNPTLDKAWELVLRDQKDFDRKLAEVASLPAVIATWFANPALSVVAIGLLLVKLLIERFVEREIAYTRESDALPHTGL